MGKIKKADMKVAIKKHRGNISAIARTLSVTWHSARDYIKKYPDLTLLHEGVSETILDVAEDRLSEAADRGESWAIKFLLQTKGKNRGYTERQEIEHSGGIQFKDLTVNIVDGTQHQ